jgi:hypothetical protein
LLWDFFPLVHPVTDASAIPSAAKSENVVVIRQSGVRRFATSILTSLSIVAMRNQPRDERRCARGTRSVDRARDAAPT